MRPLDYNKSQHSTYLNRDFFSFLWSGLHIFHFWQCEWYLSLPCTWWLWHHIPLHPPRRPQLSSPFPFPDSMKKAFFEVDPRKDPNDNSHHCQGRAEAGEPNAGRSAIVQPPVEAYGLAVHEEEVSFPEWLNFMGSGVTDWQAGNACSQDQETQGQGHLKGDRDRNLKCSFVPPRSFISGGGNPFSALCTS